MVNTKPNKQ